MRRLFLFTVLNLFPFFRQLVIPITFGGNIMKNVTTRVLLIFALFMGWQLVPNELDARQIGGGGGQDAPVEFLYSIGSTGTADGQLDNPTFVELDSTGKIFVSEWINRRVSVFDQAGAFLYSFGQAGSGNGQFEQPGGIAIDSQGNILIPDRSQNRVQVFDNAGAFLWDFGAPGTGNGQFAGSYGIALDGTGNIYVTDSFNNRVQVFDDTGIFQFAFGSEGTLPGQFNYPMGIVFDSAGDIYITDRFNHRVQIFDNAGNFLRGFGSMGVGDGQFNHPFGISLDEDGNIYVAELLGNRVQVFNNSGDFLYKFGTSGNADGEFNGAAGITVVGQRIYVGDHYNDRVQVFGIVSDTMVVSANSFMVSHGLHVSGGLMELAASDNADLSLQRATADIQSRTEFEAKGVSPMANPSSLEVTLEGAVFARSTVNQTIELYDYVTDAWEQVDTRPATRFTDSMVTVAATGDLSRFVEAGTMCMMARIRYQSPVARQQFSSNTDQFIWTIGQ